jgi:hypothetical protein
MGYIPGFNHDIFVSYARNDDHEQWVARFIKTLEARVKQRLGDADALEVYFDRKQLKPNEELAALTHAARHSAVFLAIGSPSYAKRQWTRDELAAFITGNKFAGRVFTAEHLPLDQGQTYPDPLGHQHRLNFWREAGLYSKTANTIPPDDPEFSGLANDLAEHIKTKLLAMRGSGAAALVTAESGMSRYRPVLLAHPAGERDLRRRLAELRTYLRESGVPVTRETVFPMGGQEFRAAFAADLERAAVVVHLLGEEPADPPDEESPSYTQIQEAAAREKDVKILRWHSPELDRLDDIQDEAQRALLKTATTGSFEEFKAAVVKAAEKPQPQPLGIPVVPGAPRKPIVFVDAHMNDKALARQACSAFDPERFLSLIPFWEGEGADFGDSLKDGVKKCDALVLIYGKVTPGYVRKRCEEYVTMRYRRKRTQPARIVAIIYCPPDQKEPVGVFSSELEHYVITADGAVPEPMRPNEGSRIFTYPDIDQAISRVIEKLGA